MGKSAPKAPDPKETAAAQTGTNVTTALANAQLGNVNKYGPDGSVTYSQSGSKQFRDPTNGAVYDIPQYNQTTTLSPQQQAIKDQTDAAQLNLGQLANSQSSRLQGLLGTPFTLNGLPAGGDASKITAPNYQQFQGGPDLKTSYVDDFSADKQKVQDALMSRLQPSLDKDRAALEQRLANQGIQIGSQAYKDAMDDYGRTSNDARTSTLLAAGQEQSRLAGLSRDQATFGNTSLQQMFQNKNTTTGANNSLQDQLTNAQLAQFNAANQQRQLATSEKFAERNQPLNEISGLLSGSQISMPQFGASNMPSIPTVDYAGLVNQKYQSDVNAYNQKMGMTNGIVGGLFGLGAKAIAASDERVKKDIQKVGKANGHNLYMYHYKGEPDDAPKRLGLLAQEVKKKKPSAVVEMPGGLLAVDYGKALGA